MVRDRFPGYELLAAWGLSVFVATSIGCDLRPRRPVAVGPSEGVRTWRAGFKDPNDRRCGPEKIPAPQGVRITLPTTEMSGEEVFEARLELDLQGDCVHELRVVWSDADNRTVYQEPASVDGRFGRQSFVAHFWLQDAMFRPLETAAPSPWSIRVFVDGYLVASETFLAF